MKMIPEGPWTTQSNTETSAKLRKQEKMRDIIRKEDVVIEAYYEACRVYQIIISLP